MNIELLLEPFPTFARGFILCASLIIVIGPQNLLVLKQGLQRQHLFAAAFTCTLLDFVLISLGIGGLGGLIGADELIMTIALYVGALCLGVYGLLAWRSAWRGAAAALGSSAVPTTDSVRKTIAATLAVSTLNPAAYIDTLLLIGTTSGQYAADERIFFGIGAMVASTLWFFTLAYGSSLLAPLFSRPLAWRVLDILSGSFMFGMAGMLCLPL